MDDNQAKYGFNVYVEAVWIIIYELSYVIKKRSGKEVLRFDLELQPYHPSIITSSTWRPLI